MTNSNTVDRRDGASDVDEVRRILDPMLGLSAWSPELGYASFLTIEFGAAEEQRTRRGDTYVHGEWHLWIYGSAWRIETSSAVLAASEDTREVMSAGVAALDGLAITAIEITKPALETTFRFEAGYALRVFPIFSGAGKDDMEQWLLFMPGHMVLSVGPGASWSHHRSDEPSPTNTAVAFRPLAQNATSIELAFADLKALVEAWCDRHALLPLTYLLPAFPAPLAHTDGFDDLRDAVRDAMIRGRDELNGDEEDRLAEVIAAIDAHVRPTPPI